MVLLEALLGVWRGAGVEACVDHKKIPLYYDQRAEVTLKW